MRGEALKCIDSESNIQTVDQMVGVLEMVFGDIDTADKLISEYYAAEQQQEETVAQYGVRLNSILASMATKKCVNVEFHKSQLPDRFFEGLYNDYVKTVVRINKVENT